MSNNSGTWAETDSFRKTTVLFAIKLTTVGGHSPCFARLLFATHATIGDGWFRTHWMVKASEMVQDSGCGHGFTWSKGSL